MSKINLLMDATVADILKIWTDKVLPHNWRWNIYSNEGKKTSLVDVLLEVNLIGYEKTI
jgi:hypothetical protein